MKLIPILQKQMEDWKQISGLDFALVDENNNILLATASRKLPSEKRLDDFRQSGALSLGYQSCVLFRLSFSLNPDHILLVWGDMEKSSVIGQLAVSQIESLVTAYAEKDDRNSFLQGLLLERYTSSEAASKARKLHLTFSARRAVFLIQTKGEPDEAVLATIRSLFSTRARDYVLVTEDHNVAVIRELQESEELRQLEDTAAMMVDMLSTEAMTNAWVSCSSPAQDLFQLGRAYREARTALEVGRVFYEERNVFSYSRLGIGRLIYQLPVDICEMFLEEVFGNEEPDSLDEESMNTIRTLFENNLNIAETSRQLYVHRNTLVYRFEKLQKKFGLDVRTFEDALTFKLAMLVSSYIKFRKAT